METIAVEISWSDKNYCCGWGYQNTGAVIVTDKTLEGVKRDFEETLRWHIRTMAADGDPLPGWLVEGAYHIEYSLSVSAMLRQAERYTTMAAISRATGINQKQLSHYASSVKKPRQCQRKRIVDGLHKIGESFLAIH